MNGSVQTFTAPVDGWYEVNLWGAKGGDDFCPWAYRQDACDGGNGGYTHAEIYLRTNQSYYVYVGSSGASGTSFSGAGYNGGGGSGMTSGAGGGATDIRLYSGQWYQNLGSRILVAGGGGGGGSDYYNQGYRGHGGAGGGLVGQSGAGGLQGGTQTSAGPRGQFGIGGTPGEDGGGGGGGWYGGGASTLGDIYNAGQADVKMWDQGGGGGSSYIGGQPGVAIRNTNTVPGNMNMPNISLTGQMVGNDGPCYCYVRLKERG